MAFDPNKFLTADTIAAFEAALKAAYDQGFSDGIDRVVQAAKSPLSAEAPIKGVVQKVSPTGARADALGRAPRGIVPNVVGEMVRASPGLTIGEYEQMVTKAEPLISVKSVGNELRRGEGKRYKRDRPNGYKWYPLDYEIEVEGTAGSAPSTSFFHSNQGGSDGTTLASH